jgi:hypothetical protein
MKDFIYIPGHAINPAAITHIKYNRDGSVVVMLGADSLSIDPEHAKVFFDAAPKAPVVTPAGEATALNKAAAAANARNTVDARNFPAGAAGAPAPLTPAEAPVVVKA